MSYTLRLFAEVESDAIAAYEWYEERATGLGDGFLRDFHDVATDLLGNPQRYRVVDRTIRRCLLRRFPYSTYFTIEDEMVLVIGLFHCARDPRRIASELNERDQ